MSNRSKARSSHRARSKEIRNAAPAAPSLEQIQADFQRAIIDGDDGVLAHICDNSRTGRDTLFGVYRHAYSARLIEIIRTDYAQLAAYVGDSAFDALARLYIDKNPSTSPNARWISSKLPEFLAATPPYRAHPEVADLATIERALGDCFDSADGDVLELATLACVAPDDWAYLVFKPNPAVRRIDLTSNAFEIWQALYAGELTPEETVRDSPQRLLVWRAALQQMIRPLGTEEAMIWDEAIRGVRFGILCEMAATFDNPETAALRVAQYLQTWISAGVLSDARLTKTVAVHARAKSGAH